VELDVKVVPGASRSEIVGLLGNRLKVRIAAPAEGGKANRALVKLLRESLSTREVEIVAGHSRAEKTVRILGRVRLSDLGLETED
jgi:hypothetical protein